MLESRDHLEVNRNESKEDERSTGFDKIDEFSRPGLNKFDIGSRIEARYRGKSRYYPGEIARIRLNGTYDINYDDGEKELSVHQDLIRPVAQPSVRFADEVGNNISLSSDKEAFNVGDEVEAKFRGKGTRWYKGKITRVRPNGTYDVQYDDGDRETGLSLDNIRKVSKDAGNSIIVSGLDTDMALSIGVRVEARYRGGPRYYSGVISRVRLNGSFDVDYDDGEKETGVSRDLIRLLDENLINNDVNSVTSSGSSSFTSTNDQICMSFKQGDLIQAKFRGKGSRWYKGKISRVRLNGTFDVDYDDGDRDLGLQAESIRRAECKQENHQMSLIVGTKVEARYRKRSTYELGQIAKDNKDGTYNIAYENGRTEKSVALELIRIKVMEVPDKKEKKLTDDAQNSDATELSSQNETPTLKEGDQVEAKFRGKGKRWYKGIIALARKNGTFDINYNDGDHDTGLSATCIRKIDGQTENDKPNNAKDESIVLEVGTKVEARYKGKEKFYPGKITRSRLNGTFDILYDDGDKDLGISRDLIRPYSERSDMNTNSMLNEIDNANEEEAGKSYELKVGSKVGARYRGKSTYYPGSVSRIRLNGTYDISYNEGEKEVGVSRDLIRLLKSPNDNISNLFETNEKTSSIVSADSSTLNQGDIVEAKFRGKGSRWHKGKISRVRLNGTYDIQYDDGDRDTGLPNESIRLVPSNESKSFETACSSLTFTKPSDKIALSTQTVIEPSHKKKNEEHLYNRGKGNRWNKGVVSNVRVVYLYEISYDDGDRDVNITSNTIREIGKQPDICAKHIKVGTPVEVLSWQDRFAGMS